MKAGGDVPNNTIKGQYLPTKTHPYPVYSNGIGDNAIYGYTDTYSIEEDAITISARGTIGWHTIRKKCFTPIVRLITLIPKTEIATTEYVNFALYTKQIQGSQGGIPQLTIPDIKTISIPLPPLPVQQEIVAKLDKMEELVSNIENELTERKKQYTYYREQLLAFEQCA